MAERIVQRNGKRYVLRTLDDKHMELLSGHGVSLMTYWWTTDLIAGERYLDYYLEELEDFYTECEKCKRLNIPIIDGNAPSLCDGCEETHGQSE